MYRIVKRIVHTVTTVTWLVRWEDDAPAGHAIEKEITFPASYAVTEEDGSDTKTGSKKDHLSSNQIIDQGEKP